MLHEKEHIVSHHSIYFQLNYKSDIYSCIFELCFGYVPLTEPQFALFLTKECHIIMSFSSCYNKSFKKYCFSALFSVRLKSELWGCAVVVAPTQPNNPTTVSTQLLCSNFFPLAFAKQTFSSTPYAHLLLLVYKCLFLLCLCWPRKLAMELMLASSHRLA